MIKLKNDITVKQDTEGNSYLAINTLDKHNTEQFVKIVNKLFEIQITKCKRNNNKIAVFIKVKHELWQMVSNLYHLYNTSGSKELTNVIDYLIKYN